MFSVNYDNNSYYLLSFTVSEVFVYFLFRYINFLFLSEDWTVFNGKYAIFRPS